MFCTDIFGKASLKLENPRTHPTLICKYSASENFYGRVDFFLSEKRLIDSDELSQLVESPILSTTCRITLKEFSIEHDKTIPRLLLLYHRDARIKSSRRFQKV